jgi:hypothetical protein
MLVIEATHPDGGSISVSIRDGDVEVTGNISESFEDQIKSISDHHNKVSETTERKQPDGTTEEAVVEKTVEASDEDKCNRAIEDLGIEGYNIDDVYEKEESKLEEGDEPEVTPPSIDDLSNNN